MKCMKWLSSSDVCISIWSAIPFVGLGLSVVILGPTLLDLSNRVGVGISELAAILLVRSVGSVFGSVGSGFVCDHYQKASLWMLNANIFALALLTCVLPLPTHVAVLAVIMFGQGVAIASLDNGVHAIVMNIWKNKDTGPIMQIVHFLFAFGAFLSPLIAKPFISEEPSESINNTQLYNLSCFEVLEMATPNVTNDVCLSEVIDNCFNQSGDLSGDGFTNVTDCSNTSGGNLFFGYAYWIAVIPLLISIPGLLFYSVKEQCFCLQWKKKVPIEVTEDEERLQIDSDEEIEVHVDSEKEKEKELRYPNTILYKVFLFTSLFMFMYCYVGLEVSYGTYVFAFAVKGDLGFSKQRAALLSSVFWGSFAFARCFSIAISLCKTPPSFMMAGNLTGSLVASLLMVIWNNTETVIWIGSALLGASFASIFPTVMTWLSRHTIPTAKATAVLNTGALLGDMTLPLLVGLLLDNLAPVSLLYINIIFVGIAVLICVCMVTVVELWGRKWRKHRQQHFRYQRLQFNNVELTLVRDVTSEGDGCDDVTSDNREEENSFDNEEEIDT